MCKIKERRADHRIHKLEQNISRKVAGSHPKHIQIAPLMRVYLKCHGAEFFTKVVTDVR